MKPLKKPKYKFSLKNLFKLKPKSQKNTDSMNSELLVIINE